MKIKKDDNVKVITGADRGKSGKVLRAMPSTNQVVVEGVNIKAKHKKGDAGGIIRSEHPLNVSNVALADSKSSNSKKTNTKSATATKTTDEKTGEKVTKSASAKSE